VRRFVFIGAGLHGGAGMRRAALCTLGGVLLMGVGGLVATIMVIAALFRMLLDGFAAGGRALLVALLVGLLAQLMGTLLLRLGSALMRRAAGAAGAANDAMAGADDTTGRPARNGRGRTGVTIEGEIVEQPENTLPRRGEQ
jgi:hypothetical protein